MSQQAYRILSGFTCIISLTSVIGSAYLFASWFIKKKKKQHELLDEYIAYMSVAEFFFALSIFISWTNPTMNWHWIYDLPHDICIMIGAISQFCAILTTTFNFALSIFIFLPVICGTSMDVIERRKCIHLTFVFVVSIICTIIPFDGNHYGLANNAQDNYGLAPYECWIIETDPNYYLCLYLPAAIYVIFAFCLMIYARLMVKKEYYQTLIDQLTWYTIAFIWVWFASIASRIYNTVTGNSSPFWVFSLRILGLSSMGTVRTIIWWNYLKKNTKISLDVDVPEQQVIVNSIPTYVSGNLSPNLLDDLENSPIAQNILEQSQ